MPTVTELCTVDEFQKLNIYGSISHDFEVW